MQAIFKYKALVLVILTICLMVAWAAGVLADTTTTTTHDDPATKTVVVKEDDSSILGSFFRFVGDVIAFPFRMVGKAFDAIF